MDDRIRLTFFKKLLQLFCGEWIKRGQEHKEPAVAVRMGEFNDLDQGIYNESGETGSGKDMKSVGQSCESIEHRSEAEDIGKDKLQVSGLQNFHQYFKFKKHSWQCLKVLPLLT